MPRSVCVPCNRECFVRELGVSVLLLDAQGQPYKLEQGDMVECPKCGHQFVERWGDHPVISSYEVDFDKCLAEAKPHLFLTIS